MPEKNPGSVYCGYVVATPVHELVATSCNVKGATLIVVFSTLQLPTFPVTQFVIATVFIIKR